MEPIAIIGVACRFPGANNPDAFWQLLKHGVDSITEIPNSRWNVDAYYAPKPGVPGKMISRWGGLLEQVDEFDPQFFRISPRETQYIDPQQRLLLEVGWEALENAGIATANLAETNTGVFIGISNSDYGRLLVKNPTNIAPFTGTGSNYSVTANRLSYTLNLKGPSVAIDAACSSSLVALHLACQSLQVGESSLALVGGVNVILSPEAAIVYSQAGMMAKDGRCKLFDASADGFVRSEGCGVVVLKRLSEAQQNGDRILAMIKGTAVNHNGLSNGLSAPNPKAQETLIRQALERSGVKPAEISYVEAGSTGTFLGDMIEVKSLQAVLGEGRSVEQTCAIGSVKTNIGHCESAGGMAGLIKVLLLLQHGAIAPNLHFHQPNPNIKLNGTPFFVPTQVQPWTNSRRIAGISSFGFGGTNAHVIVEESPLTVSVNNPLERPLHILTLRAKSETALRQLAHRYAVYLKSQPERSLADICFTANTGRDHFSDRLSLVGDACSQLAANLELFASGLEILHLNIGQIQPRRPQVIFLFMDQGLQFVNAGRQLYETQSTFRAILDQCDEQLRQYLKKPLLSVLYPQPGADSFANADYAQPALFTLEYALAMLWRSWGVVPDVVMGHGIGRYVAACFTGVLSLEDGLRFITEFQHSNQSDPASSYSLHSSVIESILDPFEHPEALANLGDVIGVEISINSTLHTDSMQERWQCLPVPQVEWLPSLQTGQADWQELLQSLAKLYTRGISVDWRGFDKDYIRQKVALPTYPFERQRYWLPETSQPDLLKTQQSAVKYPSVQFPNQEQKSSSVSLSFEQSSTDWNQFRECLKNTPVHEKQKLLFTYIHTQVAKVLGLSMTEQLDPDQPLNQLGLESLMAIELVNSFRTALDVDIPIEKFLNGVSISEILVWISKQLIEPQFDEEPVVCRNINQNVGRTSIAQQFEVKLIETEHEREQVFKLRYNVYAEEFGFTSQYIDHSSRTIKNFLDDSSKIFAGLHNGKVIATARTSLARVSDLKFYSQLCKMQELAGDAHPQFTSITNYLIVQKEFRGSSIALELAQSVHQHLLLEEIKFNFILCEPHLIPLYQLFGYENKGCVFNPEFADNDYLMVLDLSKNLFRGVVKLSRVGD